MAVLLGQSGAGTNTANSAGAGGIEAAQYTALATGVVDTVQFFFRTGSTATNVHFAIYADSAGSPGARLSGDVVFAAPVANADNAITGFSVPVTAGAPYWIAYLYPFGGGGVFNYADFAATGGTVKDNAAGSNTTLPDPSVAMAGTVFTNIVRVYATGTITPSIRTFNSIPFM